MRPRRRCSVGAGTIFVPALLSIITSTACDTGLDGGLPLISNDPLGGVLNAVLTEQKNVVESDDGSSFDSAQRIPLELRGRTAIDGVLENAYDVDVFQFGPVAAGDIIVVDVRAPGADTRAALFGEDIGVITVNDDRNYYAGQKDPRIQATLHRDHEVIYLAVAGKSQLASFLNANDATDYTVTVTHSSGNGEAPPARGEIVWLEFGGGSSVRIAGEAPQNVPPFDVTAISGRYANTQEQVKDKIVELLEADYADFDVTFYRSDRHAPPPGDGHTILYFGGFNQSYLGLADNVDWYNRESRQEAIIYTETMRLFEGLRPTSEALAQGIANVAAHELGHLLGLDHTIGGESVMSEAASAQAVLNINAGLIAAPLNSKVFPIGLQDAPMKLMMGVGLYDASASIEQVRENVAGAQTIVVSPANDRDSSARLIEADDLDLHALGLKLCSECEHGHE
jgi:hypothetical protein